MLEPPASPPDAPELAAAEQSLAYHVLRYTPNLVRDEWVNIGVLIFHPATGERRLRLIEDEEEFYRVRRLHPQADEALLRALRDDLENRFDAVNGINGSNGGPAEIQRVLAKWDQTLSNALQLAPQKGVLGADLDAELERLYADHVTVPRVSGRAGLPGSRGTLRWYCSQVLKQARLWDRLEKSVRAAQFTFPGDPMRLDYSYRRNGTRGLCICSPCRAHPQTPNCWPTQRSASRPRRSSRPNLRPLQTCPSPTAATATASCAKPCAM